MRTSKPKSISPTFWVVFAVALIVLVAIFILNSGQRPIGEASVCFEVLTCEEGILYSDSCKKTAIGVCGEEEPLPPRTPSYNNPYLEEYYEEGDLMYAYDIDPEDDKSFLGPPPTVYPDGDDKSYLGPPEDDFFNRPDVISVGESEFYELPTSIDEESRIRSLDQIMYDEMMDTYYEDLTKDYNVTTDTTKNISINRNTFDAAIEKLKVEYKARYRKWDPKSLDFNESLEKLLRAYPSDFELILKGLLRNFPLLNVSITDILPSQEAPKRSGSIGSCTLIITTPGSDCKTIATGPCIRDGEPIPFCRGKVTRTEVCAIPATTTWKCVGWNPRVR